MKDILVIFVLTLLRLGIPVTLLLLLGEAAKHRNKNSLRAPGV